MPQIPRNLSQRNSRRTSRSFARADAELLEQRVLLAGTSVTATAAVSAVESFTGANNNLGHPTWGQAGTDLLRLSAAQYANGVNTPSLPNNPSPRLVSNIINNQADPANPSENVNTVDQKSLSDFAYVFGQFMDHDIDLTQGTGPSMPIPVPAGDPIGGPNGTPLAFNASQTDPATGTGPGNPLQDVNSITAYFDLSQVYGSDVATDNALRTFSGGQMKTSPGGLPPLYNSTYFTPAQLAAINAAEGGMANGSGLPQSQMFVTGDTRGNENVELTALQALFLDNHNRLAAQLQKANPTWTDQQLFDEARKLNIAQYQEIIYNGWIPAVLGTNALPKYTGYNSNVNPGIADEFSTVAFRFGHSLLSGEIGRDANNGQALAPQIPLEQDFFDPYVLNGRGMPSTTDPTTGLVSTDIGAILKADADGVSQASDVQAINEVRNELFNEVIPGVGYGQDLIALDIQRAREQGIGSYNQLRVAMGLPAVTSFAQITKNLTVQKELQQAYGTVDNIDPFEGGLAEDHVAGSDVGPLFQAIMVNQFTRLRDGDRFFYLNEKFTPAEQAILQQGDTLAKVIEANTEVTNLQSDVFTFRASISGTVGTSIPFPGGHGSISIGVPGIKVMLEDTDGNVLATTTTDRQGKYSFNQLSGPGANIDGPYGVTETGSYKVVLGLPSWIKQVTPSLGTINISRGDVNVTGINFGLRLNLPLDSASTAGTNTGSPAVATVANASNGTGATNRSATASASRPTPTSVASNKADDSDSWSTSGTNHSSGGTTSPAFLDQVFDPSSIGELWKVLNS